MKLTPPPYSIVLDKKIVDLSVPAIMAIVNLTHDSFYAKSRTSASDKEFLTSIEEKIKAGATILDLGAQSTRPRSRSLGSEMELEMLEPAIKMIKEAFPTMPISVDTYQSAVAKKTLDMGVSMINDVSAGEMDRGMLKVVAEYKVPYCANHMKGTPMTMQNLTNEYSDVLVDVYDYLNKKKMELEDLGIHDIILDVGFGFGKDLPQNFKLLKNLDFFAQLNCPMLVGISRKSMWYKLLGTDPEKVLPATTFGHTLALQTRAAQILRVHDVEAAMQVIKLTSYMNKI